jgi:reactive intermediate/imine deaminase
MTSNTFNTTNTTSISKEIIHTNDAPQAIGCYSQAVKAGNTVYLSGQIGLDPLTMNLVAGFEAQAQQTFKNFAAVVTAAGGTLDNIVKLNVYLLDMTNFALVNEVMAQHFNEPYPARAAVAVKELPKGALIEIDGIMVI